MKKPTFTNYTVEQLIKACAESICWADVCRALSISQCNQNTKKLKSLIAAADISITHFDYKKALSRGNRTKVAKQNQSRTQYSIDELKEHVVKSQCWSDVCRFCNVSVCTFNINRIKFLCIEHDIDVSHFDIKLTFKRNKIEWTPETLLVEDCNICRSSLRPILKRFGLYTGICDECKNSDTWNGKPLTIEIDHINGNHRDNRIENLRWMCPNCHSQTPTYRRTRKYNTVNALIVKRNNK